MKLQGALEIGFVCMLFILVYNHVHALVFHLNSNMWKLVHLADNPALSTIKYHQIIIDNDKMIAFQWFRNFSFLRLVLYTKVQNIDVIQYTYVTTEQYLSDIIL